MKSGVLPHPCDMVVLAVAGTCTQVGVDSKMDLPQETEPLWDSREVYWDGCPDVERPPSAARTFDRGRVVQTLRLEELQAPALNGPR